MASIKAYKGGWRVWISRAGVRATKTFESKREAIAWANAQEVKITVPITGRYTLHMALDKFAEEEAPKRRGERWEVIRCRKLKRELEDKRLAELTPAFFVAWRDAQIKVRAESSVRREMNLLKAVLSVARKEWGWLEHDPLADVKRPPNARARMRGLRQEEIDAIVAELGWEEWVVAERRADEVAIAFLLGVETAMRNGELLSLEWQAVDLERRVARLTRTKNGDDRAVPLSTRAVKLLRCLPRVGDRCFQVDAGVRDVVFREARDAAGLHDVHFHDSRSEGISRLARKFDNVLDLARITGHRDIRSLMHYYVADAADLAKRLD